MATTLERCSKYSSICLKSFPGSNLRWRAPPRWRRTGQMVAGQLASRRRCRGKTTSAEATKRFPPVPIRKSLWADAINAEAQRRRGGNRNTALPELIFFSASRRFAQTTQLTPIGRPTTTPPFPRRLRGRPDFSFPHPYPRSMREKVRRSPRRRGRRTVHC